MASIEVSVEIAAHTRTVWKHLSDLSSHSNWMKDAECIIFESRRRRGVGVRMKVPTRVGFLRVADVIEVDIWTEGKSIGVRHRGRIGGRGLFRLSAHSDGSVLTLTENLRFPWYMGGAVVGWFARPILRRVFRSNLIRFRDRVEAEFEQKG